MDYYSYPVQALPQHPQQFTFEAVQLPLDHAAPVPPQSARSSGSYKRSRTDDEAVPPPRPHNQDSKPRLGKEQQEILERHFQAQPKPTTQTKKNFADQLGVPLEKINNWFQNRRAKVKQDAKKQQGQYNLVFSSDSGRQSGRSLSTSFIDASFYNQRTLDTSDSSLGSTAPLHMPGIQIPSNHHESAHLFDHVGSGMHVDASELTMNEPAVFNAYFGLDGHDETHNVGHQDMSLFGRQFSGTGEQKGNQFELFDGFPMDVEQNYSTSTATSLFTRSSQDSSSVAINAMSGDYPMPSTDMIDHSMRTKTSQDFEPCESPSSWSSAPQSNGQPSNPDALAMYHPVQMPIPEHGQSQFIPGPAPVSSHSIELHEDQSGMNDQSMLRYGHDSTEKPLIRTGPGFKHINVSGLAARRQRRPAALGLGTEALRSSSFNAGPATTSPTSTLTPDMKLRRIHSSNGVTNGRIQKSSLPAQRSPLHFTFNEASTASPQPYRPISTTPRQQLPFAYDSTGPPTPLSALEAENGPLSCSSDHMTGSYVWLPDMPEEYHTSAGLQSISPPPTPLEAAQMAQLRIDSSTTPRLHQPPHSAPAWQQNFDLMPQHYPPMPFVPAKPVYRPSTAGEEVASIVADRRRTEPTALWAGPKEQMNSIQVQRKSVSPAQAPAPSSTFASMQSTFINQTPAVTSPSSKASTMSPKTPADIVFHEYAPREPADPSRLPPKSKVGATPTTYQFHYVNPDSFSP